MRKEPIPDSVEDLMSRGLTLQEARAMTRAYREALDLRIVDSHGNERVPEPGPSITDESKDWDRSED